MKMKLSRHKPDKKQEKTYTSDQIKKRPGVYYDPIIPETIIITLNPNSHGEMVTLVEYDEELILPFKAWKGDGYVELKGEKLTLEIST